MSEPTLSPKSGFSRFKLELTYDGTNYFGWARQPDLKTLQGEMEGALATIFGEKIESVVAGRTDSGVHAAQQFIHIDLPESSPVENLVYRLNRILDSDIRVLNFERVSGDFHARFSAKSRKYIYKIADNNQIVPPLARFDTAEWFRPLDENLMNEACAQLIGSHDFKAFCKFREIQNTVRTLREFSWHRSGEILIAEVEADSFCYSMVRNLVGAAVCIGEGRFPKEWLLKVLTEQERISESYVFPAQGLTLVSITY